MSISKRMRFLLISCVTMVSMTCLCSETELLEPKAAVQEDAPEQSSSQSIFKDQADHIKIFTINHLPAAYNTTGLAAAFATGGFVGSFRKNNSANDTQENTQQKIKNPIKRFKAHVSQCSKNGFKGLKRTAGIALVAGFVSTKYDSLVNAVDGASNYVANTNFDPFVDAVKNYTKANQDNSPQSDSEQNQKTE